MDQWNNPSQRFERRGRCIAAVGGKSICIVMGSGGEGRADAIIEMLNERVDLRGSLDEAVDLLTCVDTSMSERVEFATKMHEKFGIKIGSEDEALEGSL